MMIKKPRIFSGIQPSSVPTLGNYLGAIRNWVHAQDEHECFFCVVDNHALTTAKNPGLLRDNRYGMIAFLLAAGIDTRKSMLFWQSQVAAHCELAWLLTCHTYIGELQRMTQFKEKSSTEGTNIGAGLLCYPILMAADILLYQPEKIPVGADQKQHVELTRDIAIRMNNRYKNDADGDLFRLPEPWIFEFCSRIMDLQDPLKKMSKSSPSGKGCIFLDDTDAQIQAKIMATVTDSGNQVKYSKEKPGISNLIEIHSAFSNLSIADIEDLYRNKSYGEFKKDVAGLVVQKWGTIRDQYLNLREDRAHLDMLARDGAMIAAQEAEKTLSKLKATLGY